MLRLPSSAGLGGLYVVKVFCCSCKLEIKKTADFQSAEVYYAARRVEGKAMTVLGVTGLSVAQHDNSAAIVRDGKILFASSEERFSRQKHDPSFPVRTIRAGLQHCGLRWKDIDCIAVGMPTFDLKTLVRQYPGELLRLGLAMGTHSPWQIGRAIMEIPRAGLSESSCEAKRATQWIRGKQVVMLDHHLAHAASAFFTSGKARAIAIVLDAYGAKTDRRLRSGGIYRCAGKSITCLEEIPVERSLGILYTAVTTILGFTPKDAEGKVMGLSAYGKEAQSVKRKMKKLWKEGHFWIDGLLAARKEWRGIFETTPLGRVLKRLREEVGDRPEDLACAVQTVLEEEGVWLVRSIHARFGNGQKNDYVLAGGIFLNVRLNMKIRELPFVRSVFVHPNPGDGGTALGAALLESSKFKTKNSKVQLRSQKLTSVALGVGYTNREMLQTLRSYKGRVSWIRPKDVAAYTAEALIAGKVVGWFQGRAEWGPRALGSRSVLADPRDPKIKDRINQVLKERDWFMPFAPAILEERVQDVLVGGDPNPFMTQVYRVRPAWAKKIPAAIHVDNTCRPQTVNRKDHPLYYAVIAEFYRKTGVPAVLNTSFNRHGLPIVNAPRDAIEHLLWGCVDALILGPWVVKRLI